MEEGNLADNFGESNGAAEPHRMDTGGIAGDQLRSFVERYERLQEELDALNEDRQTFDLFAGAA